MWPIEVKNIRCMCLDARWRDGNRVYALSLASRGVKRTRCSAYGNSGPSGVVSRRGDRLRSGPDDWSSGKYNRWLSGASSGSVGLGYDNRPGDVILAYRNRHSPYAFG
ncbi:hypothetical protein PIB30_061573 [Stylosanthes scabra]|uniref:Uncharacterized protein n=1 Tax=Stylosanthes scabra TaxID=79078 RepID=A0ABU6XJ42_9FABA|nr:hypothetical protein [Stylosanthes scabra]